MFSIFFEVANQQLLCSSTVKGCRRILTQNTPAKYARKTQQDILNVRVKGTPLNAAEQEELGSDRVMKKKTREKTQKRGREGENDLGISPHVSATDARHIH